MSASDYSAFLATKRVAAPSCGVSVSAADLHPRLFPFQRDITAWAIRKGRAAIFAGTGMGKTLMQLVWAQALGKRTLLLAPLAVANQTVGEGSRFGIPVVYAQDENEAAHSGIVATNYERLDKFDIAAYGAVVLDESSILKSFTGKIRTALIRAFRDVPYRLCCTATPAPNDIAEIANHAEFLGVMTRVEMLATFFVHDDEGWRLKKHAVKPFYCWLASWAMTITKPSDLGYDDDGFILPELRIKNHFLETDAKVDGQLFPTVRGIQGRTAVRRATIDNRIRAAASLVLDEPAEPWLLWHGMNAEGWKLKLAIPGMALVEGSDSLEDKVERLTGFCEGRYRVLATKPRIAGFGMNFQHCARAAFVGLGDSWEQYYQAIRRCWRFRQTRDVEVHVILTEPEMPVWDNVMAKERQAEDMIAGLIAETREYEEAELGHAQRHEKYVEAEERGESWRMIGGDAAEKLRMLPDASVDLSIFSPPFSSLYTYSNSERDLGNSRDTEQFFEHFAYVSRELLRVMKPGRNVCVHCMQLPLTKQTDGVIGLRDFRGDLIRHFVSQGFIYHGEVCINRNPQSQATRTHAKGLLFVQLRKDSSWMRPAYADYILVFRVPGENAVPVHTDISNEQWIEWAQPVWMSVRETDTLNAAEARGNEDERHICPLSLDIIERCVRLWSNPGELVLTPFAGIGSEVYQAVLNGRRGIGIELKCEYWETAVRNCREAERRATSEMLFTSEQLTEAKP